MENDSRMGSGEACPSDLLLERSSLGELPPGAQRQLEAHLRTCAHCPARVARLGESDLSYRSSASARGLAQRLRGAPAARPFAARWVTRRLLPSLAAALLLLVLRPGLPPGLVSKGLGGFELLVEGTQGAQVLVRRSAARGVKSSSRVERSPGPIRGSAGTGCLVANQRGVSPVGGVGPPG